MAYEVTDQPEDAKNYIEGVVTLASDTLKSLILINGAAAGGLLTFYGNAVSNPQWNKDYLVVALVTFALGVGFAVTASIFAYLAQLGLAMRRLWNQKAWMASMATGCLSAMLFFAGIVCGALAIP